MNSQEAQQRILRHLAQAPSHNMLSDKEIAQDTGLDIQFVRDNLSVLKDERLVDIIEFQGDDTSSMEAALSSRGRLVLHDQDQPSSTPAASPPISDAYTSYELGLDRLRSQLGINHPNIQEALLFEARLRENITLIRLYSDTPTLKADRMQVIDQLNRLAMGTLGFDFNGLCSTSQTALEPTPEQRQQRLEYGTLAAIKRAEEEEGATFDRAAVAQELGTDVEQIHDLMYILSDKGYIMLFLGGGTMLTAYGRTALRSFAVGDKSRKQ